VFDVRAVRVGSLGRKRGEGMSVGRPGTEDEILQTGWRHWGELSLSRTAVPLCHCHVFYHLLLYFDLPNTIEASRGGGGNLQK